VAENLMKLLFVYTQLVTCLITFLVITDEMMMMMIRKVMFARSYS